MASISEMKEMAEVIMETLKLQEKADVYTSNECYLKAKEQSKKIIEKWCEDNGYQWRYFNETQLLDAQTYSKEGSQLGVVIARFKKALMYRAGSYSLVLLSGKKNLFRNIADIDSLLFKMNEWALNKEKLCNVCKKNMDGKGVSICYSCTAIYCFDCEKNIQNCSSCGADLNQLVTLKKRIQGIIDRASSES